MYDPTKPYKNKIIDLIKQTWSTKYVLVEPGTYPIIKKKFNFPEVDHTDGIGTKGYYHWKQNTFHEAVIDALAMNLNDLALVRAKPYKVQNHITVPTEDERVVKIIEALAIECKNRELAITGGENSFHENLVGLDISITMSGFLEKYQPNHFQIGDVLIGLPSSGIHSNGFTLVRKLFKDEIRPEFTQPTKIYLDQILQLENKVHGMMHITGGAFSKLKDLLYGADIYIPKVKNLNPQEVFYELYSRSQDDYQMYTTFNCGIGFILSVPASEVDQVIDTTNGAIIGQVRKGDGRVIIESMFSDKKLEV